MSYFLLDASTRSMITLIILVLLMTVAFLALILVNEKRINTKQRQELTQSNAKIRIQQENIENLERKNGFLTRLYEERETND